MNFKTLCWYEPGLEDLARRMRAVRFIIDGYYTADFDDLVELIGESTIGLPNRDLLCVSKLEIAFTESLLRLAGPGGLHPKLKDPESFQLAHQHLWRGFPVCGRLCKCQREQLVP